MENENGIATSTPLSVPANTFGVQAGQIWEDTDRRRPRKVAVTAINDHTGMALVHNVENGRRSKVRLDRFSPVHHMRKSAV